MVASEQVVEGFAPTAAQLRDTPAAAPTPISTSRIPSSRASGLAIQIPGRAEIAL